MTNKERHTYIQSARHISSCAWLAMLILMFDIRVRFLFKEAIEKNFLGFCYGGIALKI